ncbi:Aldehyde/histidinol dehydrogenase [Microdochium bolleyi]|uniref:aldehyde dehydrogenase (NAD(+)) n=1 Tax=Microdochium bolleyi TaxID=196109 RepID=A0A136JA22_9PEZI|nr:Aldehyde/histidinol dehydrogenase [Microdochium bolleyi]
MSAVDFLRRLWAPPDAHAVTDLQSWIRQFTVLLSKFPISPVASIAVPVVALVLAGVLLYVTHVDPLDKPKRYTVPAPKIPDDNVILNKPTLKSSGGSTAIQCYAPATGQFLGYVNPSTPAGLDRAIAQASEAQKTWAKTTFAERRRVLRTMLQYVLDNAEQICRVSSLDSGKTMLDAQLGEILVTAEKLQWTLKHGEEALRPSRRPTNLLMSYKRNTVHYEPLGVVAALVSWNYPFHNLVGPIISSIFAGNGIIVKVSEQTCWSAAYYTSIVRGALVAHGHDPQLVQSAVCWPQTAGHLTSHPQISHVTFIGSRPVCHHVAASAAKTLTPVVAELGGKDAALVLDSAKTDLNRIVEILLRGSFQAAGQNCIGIERVIATPQVYPKLVEMLEPRVRAMRLGLDKDMGAMVSDASFSRLEKLVDDAVSKGARLLAGGRRYVHPDHPSGFYFSPTLLVDVTPDMAVANEECFGPIMTVMPCSTPSSPSPNTTTDLDKTADEILALVNAPDFGLGASIYASPRDPLLPRLVRGIRAGGVAVNDFAVFYAVQLPFGGVGGSGYGRFAGEEGLRGVCNAKSVCEDRWGWLGIQTAIPPPARYPVRDQDKGWAFANGIVGLGYELTLGGKAKGLWRLLRNS